MDDREMPDTDEWRGLEAAVGHDLRLARLWLGMRGDVARLLEEEGLPRLVHAPGWHDDSRQRDQVSTVGRHEHAWGPCYADHDTAYRLSDG